MRRARTLAAGAAGVGLLTCAVGLAIDPDAVLRGWLAGFAVWLGLPLGALMLAMAHGLTGGHWGQAVRSPLRATAAAMPLAGVFLLPLLLGLPHVYPWTRPEVAARLPNVFYLNGPFFVARAVLFVALWCLLAWLGARRPSGTVAVAGLLLLAPTATLAAFDWTMSVEPDWGSSVYGMVVISGHLLSALAFVTLAAVATGRTEAVERRDLGSLLIAGVLLWVYLSFMQFLIVWQGNLPHEITWYVARLRGGWGVVAAAGLAMQGVLPFFALIWWPVKRSRRGLTAVCVLLLAGHALEGWWLVLPGTAGGWTWFAPAATLAMGGSFATLFLSRRGGVLREHAGASTALAGEAPHG